MSACKLCGKDLSKDFDEEICETCQGIRESIVQEQKSNAAVAKKNRHELLYLFLAILSLIFIVNLATKMGDGKAEAAAENAVQELIFSETGLTPYFKSTVEYRSPVSSFVIVSYSPSKEEMRQGIYSYRIVNVNHGSREIDSISEEYSSTMADTP